MTMFDKLGDLLSEALEKGELPKSEKESQSERVEEPFSDFQFSRQKENQNQPQNNRESTNHRRAKRMNHKKLMDWFRNEH